MVLIEAEMRTKTISSVRLVIRVGRFLQAATSITESQIRQLLDGLDHQGQRLDGSIRPTLDFLQGVEGETTDVMQSIIGKLENLVTVGLNHTAALAYDGLVATTVYILFKTGRHLTSCP